MSTKQNDRLEELMKLQKHMMLALDERYQKGGFGIEAVKADPEAMCDRALVTLNAITNEVAEIQGELPWKSWKAYPPAAQYLSEVDRHGRMRIDRVKEEAVDLLFFVLELYHVLGMRAEDVYDIYKAKHQHNLSRVVGDWARTPSKV